MNIIEHNLATIVEDLRNCAQAAGRDPTAVRLVAVSKTFPVASVQEAYRCGQRLFGENRIQELEQKREQLPADIEWHMIGHLQTNKAKTAVHDCALIHSVDSAKILDKINQAAAACGKVQNILLQVNVSGEVTKTGAAADDVEAILRYAIGLPAVRCLGFMTMAPFEAQESTLGRIFSGLRTFRDAMEKQYGVALPELSMGMSGDYRVAIREGATLVRIGTALFGARGRNGSPPAGILVPA